MPIKFPEPKITATQLLALQNIPRVLSPRQLEVFTHLCYGRKTIAETASAMSVTPATVRQTLAVLINKVRVYGTKEALRTLFKLVPYQKRPQKKERACRTRETQQPSQTGLQVFLTREALKKAR